MGFGGPVWHASAAHANRRVRRKAALKALEGVGAKALGEWHDDNARAYHVRRRLSASEQSVVGGVRDLRGTAEAKERLSSFLGALAFHPAFDLMRQAALEELADST